MKTSIETIAKFFGVIAWADNEFTADEKEVIGEIAKSYEFSPEESKQLLDAVEASFAEIKDMDEDSLNAYLVEASSDIEEEDANYLFEGALELALADGLLCTEEVDNLLGLADALGIETAHAVLMIADMVKDDPEIEIAF